MSRIHNFQEGQLVGSYTVIGITTEGPKKKYICRCKCGEIVKRIGFELNKRNKCRKCNINNTLSQKNHKTTFISHIKGQNFNCICDCGNKFIGRRRSKSCGCHVREGDTKRAKELVGRKFNGLHVKKFLGFKQKTNSTEHIACYEVQCICGKTIEKNSSALKKQKTCGCRMVNSHARGELQGNAKRNKKTVLMIKELFLSGSYSRKELSEIFCISEGCLSDYINCKSWKHVTVDKDILHNSPVRKKYDLHVKKILEGEKYGEWLVLNKVGSKHKRAYYLCQCSCGKLSEVPASYLRLGGSTKCYDCNARNFANLNRKIKI